MDSSAPDIHLFQIAYSEATREAIEPGYAMLDNLDNPRPDWYEYWPIRRYLLEQPLDEQVFYGFFSPKFGRKTRLSAAQVRDFVTLAAPHADVVLFSPLPDMGAVFKNVFVQYEAFDPGFVDVCTQWLQAIGQPVALRELVMDSSQVVFSNYFVARPAFWREWLLHNETLFAICEDGGDSPLRRALCQATNYPGAPQRKVFVQERTASLLLSAQPGWRSVAHNPFGFAWSASKLSRYPLETVICDALKMAWRVHGFSEYLEALDRVHSRLANAPEGPAASA